MSEAGSGNSYPILLMLLICIGLTVYAFLKGDENGKFKDLISHVGLLALVWGFLGMMIGLIGAFDAISIANDVSSQVIAGGLKVGLLSPVFGMFAFLIARLGIIILVLKKK
ncbi:hypothetical protein EYW44_16285 [Tenacibaculum sp. M341]|nr:hypothetical protein EYW44_16285 [Tenacibaculum sp. M341]